MRYRPFIHTFFTSALPSPFSALAGQDHRREVASVSLAENLVQTIFSSFKALDNIQHLFSLRWVVLKIEDPKSLHHTALWIDKPWHGMLQSRGVAEQVRPSLSPVGFPTARKVPAGYGVHRIGCFFSSFFSPSPMKRCRSRFAKHVRLSAEGALVLLLCSHSLSALRTDGMLLDAGEHV
eukprot:1063754-Rhodomonas_salina.1